MGVEYFNIDTRNEKLETRIKGSGRKGVNRNRFGGDGFGNSRK